MANAVLIDTVAVQNLIASLSKIVGITRLGTFFCLVVISNNSKFIYICK